MNNKDKTIISDCWTAEESLLICAFLESLICAVWRKHGPEMAKHLQRIHLLADTIPPDCSDPAIKDDLPF